MIYESELYHHGIKGQKWGKQNGPPYPLERQEKRKQKDFNKLTKVSEKAHKSVEKRNSTITELIMPNGQTISAVNGKADRQMYKNASKVDKLVNKLSKRYNNVDASLNITKSGKTWTNVRLDDLKTVIVDQHLQDSIKKNDKYNI